MDDNVKWMFFWLTVFALIVIGVICLDYVDSSTDRAAIENGLIQRYIPSDQGFSLESSGLNHNYGLSR